MCKEKKNHLISIILFVLNELFSCLKQDMFQMNKHIMKGFHASILVCNLE